MQSPSLRTAKDFEPRMVAEAQGSVNTRGRQMQQPSLGMGVWHYNQADRRNGPEAAIVLGVDHISCDIEIRTPGHGATQKLSVRHMDDPIRKDVKAKAREEQKGGWDYSIRDKAINEMLEWFAANRAALDRMISKSDAIWTHETRGNPGTIVSVSGDLVPAFVAAGHAMEPLSPQPPIPQLPTTPPPPAAKQRYATTAQCAEKVAEFLDSGVTVDTIARKLRYRGVTMDDVRDIMVQLGRDQPSTLEEALAS